MKNKISIIVGGSGQFGIILAKKLLKRNHKVIITSRNVKEAKKRISSNNKKLEIIKLNILTKKQIEKILKKNKPNYIFYFAGLSSPGLSFKKPKETFLSNYQGCKNFLEVIYKNNISCKFLNTSSSEIFAGSRSKLNIKSKKKPISPYGKSKLMSFNLTKKYRLKKNLLTYNAVIFNSESIYREKNYLIPKICLAAINAKKYNSKTSFGDLSVIREWNWCPEQCDYMLKFLNKKPQDFILSNNKPFSAMQMVDFAFDYFNLDFRKYILINKNNFRKKDFKIRTSDNKYDFKKNNLAFNYKIYGNKLIIKLLKYYLNKDLLK